jgi:hypothetical protein
VDGVERDLFKVTVAGQGGKLGEGAVSQEGRTKNNCTFLVMQAFWQARIRGVNRSSELNLLFGFFVARY